MRPEDILSDQVNEAEFNGVTIRKGSVAAFLANANSLREPAIDDAARQVALRDIESLLPALRALGLFEVFEIRDSALRTFVKARL